MLLPFVMALPSRVLASGPEHVGHVAASATLPFMSAVGVHTFAYFATTAIVAQVVYRKLGLQLLRTAWFNLDWAWAGALLVTGLVVLLT